VTTTSTTPSPEQARHARDHVLAQAAAAGRRPSVLAVARQLGLSNTTFRRHFPDIAEEVGDTRRTPPAGPADAGGPSAHDKLVARNAKLRRDNRQLREHLDLAIANIQRLTLQNHRQQQALESHAKITQIDKRTQTPARPTATRPQTTSPSPT
jgi:AcrR family transcriptional regulator